MDFLPLLMAVALAYLIGSIPMGWVWVKLMTGQDVRKFGSGRTGGTNASRAGGRWAGILTGVGDFTKGLVGVSLARWLVPPGALAPWAEALSGLAAVAGHNWSIYIGFKGGAGTGPNIGATTALSLWGLLLVPLVPLILIGTGYASLTSLIIAALVPLLFVALALVSGTSWAYVVYGLCTLFMVVMALRPNIVRLLNGTERRVGPRARKDDGVMG